MILALPWEVGWITCASARLTKAGYGIDAIKEITAYKKSSRSTCMLGKVCQSFSTWDVKCTNRHCDSSNVLVACIVRAWVCKRFAVKVNCCLQNLVNL
uniref:SRCR domain-containing protein n=1 Tax=Trichuris muris TaxID=70415 RepID=A0A5S6Q692_TRIMR